MWYKVGHVMKVKETIAFIGKADETSTGLIERLAERQYPVILVDSGNSGFGEVSLGILDHDPTADVAVVECAREGCWEADVIILTEGFIPDPEMLERVRTVATQKTVISLSGDETDAGGPGEKTKRLKREKRTPRSTRRLLFIRTKSSKNIRRH